MAILQLNWLEMQDFGAYKGKHRVQFAVGSSGKPVTLFGGLNGAGKTTLLEAILFVLHGKNAPTQKRSKTRYQDYLAKLVNRNSSALEAAVTLNFSSIDNGIETIWEITRYIVKKKVNHQDLIHIEVNGESDEVVKERWPIEVESLWPRHLCNILFFDGERLKELASPEATSAALREAMRLLLGGLPVSRAVGDLEELEKRIIDRADISTPDRERLDSIRTEIDEKELEILNFKNTLASLRTKKDRATLKRDRLDEAFSSQGGELVVKTREFQVEKESLEQERQIIRAELISMAGGLLPLGLIRSHIEALSATVIKERDHTRSIEVRGVLEDRDQKFLDWLEKEHLAEQPGLYEPMQEWLQAAMPAVVDDLKIDHESGLENDLQIFEAGIENEISRANKLIQRFRGVEKQLSNTERLLQQLPGEDDIILMKENLLTLEAEVRHIDKQISDLEQQLSQRSTYCDRLKQSEQISIKKVGKSMDKEAAGTRVLEQLPDLITFFRDYEKALLLNSLSEMEQHIFECFKYLFKKENFVRGLSIDPGSFEIVLHGENDEKIEIDRLSAGERQMLATSIIWALSKLSGHSSPVVIDTPVGRLDSDYRAKFIGTYLPNAGNQVIVLSTDEEIHESYYPLIADSIGSEYGLQYNETKQSSEITEGYPYKTRKRNKKNETRRVAA